jgi:hypothetical protein
MVRNRAWDAVIARARSHPHECATPDEEGNTPLHIACRLDPPPAVILAFSHAAPQCSRQANAQGATPLHIAASHRCSAHALRVLLEVGTRQDGRVSPTADVSRMGRAPIHYACLSFRGLELDAFQILLDATLQDGFVCLYHQDTSATHQSIDEDEECSVATEIKSTCEKASSVSSSCGGGGGGIRVNVMSWKDATGQTPLALLFRRYRERVRCVITTVDRVRHEYAQRPDRAALAAAMAVHADLGELWEKARWMVARLEKLLQQQQQSKPTFPTDITMTHTVEQSPGRVSKIAAAWSMEQHPPPLLQEWERDWFLSSTGTLEPGIATSTPTDATDSATKAASSTDAEGRPFRIVHASVALTGYGCPPEMIRLAISMHPHQVREMDEDGNLPLHIAVQASSFITASGAAASPYHNIHEDDMSILSDAFSFFSSATISQTTNPFDKVIKLLLQHYPDAAQIPHGRTGQLPLILALETRVRSWDDGVRTLLKAYPPALYTTSRHLVTPSLYPHVLAALTAEDSSERSMAAARTTLFELLRTKPEWIVTAVYSSVLGTNDQVT